MIGKDCFHMGMTYSLIKAAKTVHKNKICLRVEPCLSEK